ncbi:MAG: hypothetical protein IT426_21195 [Pirellulales bacterium]|nr:hypothetical protein [Pirellulales bacterium]
MPNVNDFLREAVKDMPESFVDKELALKFLEIPANANPEIFQLKETQALRLLESVANFCECQDTWDTLVKKRLVSAEKAMRYLLPAHRDHILHSAHLYLLGLSLYFRMLRPDGALLTVIADTHWRDVQSLFSSTQLSYSCFPSLLFQGEPLAQAQARLPKVFPVPTDEINRLLTNCPACSPSDRATNAAYGLNSIMARCFPCCRPGPHIVKAVTEMANAVNDLDTGSLCVCDHYPHTIDDVDAIFLRRWGLASILHDSAYPLELASKQIEDYVGEAIGQLGCSISPCKASFGISLNCLCDFVTLPLIQNVCSERFNNEMFVDNSIKLLATNICHKLHVQYSPDTLSRIMTAWLESGLHAGKVDHGVFSALLMLRRINHEIVNRLEDRRLHRELVYDNPNRRVTEHHAASAVEYFYIECVDAAAAVYLHNSLKYIDFFSKDGVDYRDHPIAWMLFLCDQLQEWLRPSGDPTEDRMKLFKDAAKYSLILDGQKLVFQYPGDSDKVAADLRKHLRLFGEDFIVHGK